MKTVRRFLTVCAAALAVAGCTVSPQPEPPSIDIQQMHFGSGAGLPLIGDAGAVTPGRAELFAVNLFDAAPEVSTHVDADGRFQLSLGGTSTDVFRLQAFVADLRSDPVDITGGMGIHDQTPVVPANETLGDCFHITPPLEVVVPAGGTRPVTMTNGCADDVRIESLRIRRETSVWSVPAATPFTVASNASRSFDVKLAAQGDVDDVLLVEITLPVTGTRAVSLVAAP